MLAVATFDVIPDSVARMPAADGSLCVAIITHSSFNTDERRVEVFVGMDSGR